MCACSIYISGVEFFMYSYVCSNEQKKDAYFGSFEHIQM